MRSAQDWAQQLPVMEQVELMWSQPSREIYMQ